LNYEGVNIARRKVTKEILDKLGVSVEQTYGEYEGGDEAYEKAY